MTCSSRTKLLVSKAAPIIRTTASETSETIKNARSRFCRNPPVMPRPLSFSDSFGLMRDACNAGARPKTIPVAAETNRAKPRTRQSTLISRMRGTFSGMSETSRGVPQRASSNPTKPPVNDNKTLSVSSCLMMRQRPAPSARRIAISFCRAEARINSRLATLAQAINRTNATVVRITSNKRRMLPTICFCNSIRLTV